MERARVVREDAGPRFVERNVSAVEDLPGPGHVLVEVETESGQVARVDGDDERHAAEPEQRQEVQPRRRPQLAAPRDHQREGGRHDQDDDGDRPARGARDEAVHGQDRRGGREQHVLAEVDGGPGSQAGDAQDQAAEHAAPQRHGRERQRQAGGEEGLLRRANGKKEGEEREAGHERALEPSDGAVQHAPRLTRTQSDWSGRAILERGLDQLLHLSLQASFFLLPAHPIGGS